MSSLGPGPVLLGGGPRPPFGRPFRSVHSVAAVSAVATDVRGTAVFALLTRGADDAFADDADAEEIPFFSGQFGYVEAGELRQLQIVARREDCSTECECAFAGGYGHYALTLFDVARRLRAVCRVARTGGTALRLSPRDAARASFCADRVLADDAADRLAATLFPKLAAKVDRHNRAREAAAAIEGGAMASGECWRPRCAARRPAAQTSSSSSSSGVLDLVLNVGTLAIDQLIFSPWAPGDDLGAVDAAAAAAAGGSSAASAGAKTPGRPRSASTEGVARGVGVKRRRTASFETADRGHHPLLGARAVPASS